jgi:baculoviral IAP repeat-containing protein 2/3
VKGAAFVEQCMRLVTQTVEARRASRKQEGPPAAEPEPLARPVPRPAHSSSDRPAGESREELEDENSRLRHMKECKVCLDAEVGVVFLPCGHLCCCVSCAPSLAACPLCRAPIQGTVRTFLS